MAATTTHPLIFLTAIALLLPLSSPLPPPLQALLSLKASLFDPLSTLSSWSLSSNLSSPSPWCSFSGVTCDPITSSITSIDLSSRNLSGHFPSSALLLLSPPLSHLNLSSNSFSGPLPQSILRLRRLLTLDISHNDFNSSFPSGLSDLRHLTVFSAYSNSFTGPLPSGLSNLSNLQHLNLGGSFFSGPIPDDIASLASLQFLHLAGNLLSGELPSGLGSLSSLEHFEIGYNSFNGGIPVEVGALRTLRYLDISSANLSGEIPSELGNLTGLESLFLFKNALAGRIPESFSGLRALKVLDLSDNQLAGPIPAGVASFGNLTLLSLMNNKLSGEIPVGIGELPNLQALLLWNNSFTGGLPPKLGLNGKLERLDVSSNSLSGPIPPGVCTGNRLVRLILFSNSFDSELPSGLARCASLWRIRIETNRFSGEIPAGFGLLPNLTYMDLSQNNFSGSIPPDLGSAPRLEFLNVSENPLRTVLPETIWGAPNLQIFSASSCGLIGEIPSFGPGCRDLYKVELAGNQLNGSIPMDIGRCSKLLNLKLNHNQLVGIIPPELSTLPSITDIDLSHNELVGPIPPSFDNSSTLENLNVSFNHLSGEVPTAGTILKNLHRSSFAGNEALCGEPVRKPCSSESWPRAEEPENTTKASAGATFVWIAAGAVGAGLVVLFVGARWTRSREEDEWPGPLRLTAFQRLNFTADDVAESIAITDQIIGMGSTGTVYRADMPSGDIIAVKKLWGRHKDEKPSVSRRSRAAAAAAAATLAEVQVLGSVRHRNIVRLLGCCSNHESTLLLYEFMPNGSLEDLLHRPAGLSGKDGTKLAGDWLTRYRIALGVAQGVCYLHHDCDPVILHRDLKPSNILLDESMEPRVADFGVAKLIHTDAKHTMSVVAGSYGYIAPEYAYTLQVDEKSDIYSFGVVLMEIVSGKRSVEAEFGEGISIVEWVRGKVSKGDVAAVMEVLDKKVGADCKQVREEMLLVLRIALLCTSKNPADRPSMRDVVSMLREARPNRKVVSGEEVGGCRGGGGGFQGMQQFASNT